jgi:UDP-N-acetyl-D-mannosaminuronate dehydrogenase
MLELAAPVGQGARVLTISVAYKADIDGAESPSLDLWKFWKRRARVTYCDPYVPTLTTGQGNWACRFKQERSAPPTAS